MTRTKAFAEWILPKTVREMAREQDENPFGLKQTEHTSKWTEMIQRLGRDFERALGVMKQELENKIFNQTNQLFP